MAEQRSPKGSSGVLWVVVFALAGMVGAVVVAGRLERGGTESARAAAPVAGGAGARVFGGDDTVKEQTLDASSEPGQPAAIVDVFEPGKVREALEHNAWTQEVLKAPLGRGLSGSWAAFLGSRGEDLEAKFKGTVFDLLASRLLSTPFRLAWFVGGGADGSPALVVPHPTAAAEEAFQLLSAVAHRGEVKIERCPGPAPKEGEKPPPGPGAIERWSLADHAVFALRTADAIVLARTGRAAQLGACTALGELTRPEGTDLQVELRGSGLGREARLLGQFLGLGLEQSLRFAVENHTLVPRGLGGPVVDARRLGVVAPPTELLKAVPESTPVLLSVALPLPEKLEVPTLQKALARGGTPGGVVRNALVLWVPHGDRDAASEVAILWSNPKDGTALRRIFDGENTLAGRELCGGIALASSSALLDRMARSCSGKDPSVLQAAPAVAEGLAQPASIALGINLGRLLGGIYRDEVGVGEQKSAVLKTADDELRALPFFGFRGTARGNALEPAGFRS